MKKGYEVDGDILGFGVGEKESGKFLGRHIRCVRGGIEWEADARHVESLVEELDLRLCKDADTPGVKADEVEEQGPMTNADASRFRRGAAKVNYITADRPDLAYASKELSRCMSSPKNGDEIKLKILVRYLHRYPRWITFYAWRSPTVGLYVYTDSDWGGCTRTRKSTSGGVILKENTYCAIGAAHNN